jgi:hypothetical protein
MFIKTSVLSLSFALSIGVAAAQPPSWPIVNGGYLQPTQQQVDSRGDTGPASGVVVSSRSPTYTTRLCADLRWYWME